MMVVYNAGDEEWIRGREAVIYCIQNASNQEANVNYKD